MFSETYNMDVKIHDKRDHPIDSDELEGIIQNSNVHITECGVYLQYNSPREGWWLFKYLKSRQKFNQKIGVPLYSHTTGPALGPDRQMGRIIYAYSSSEQWFQDGGMLFDRELTDEALTKFRDFKSEICSNINKTMVKGKYREESS